MARRLRSAFQGQGITRLEPGLTDRKRRSGSTEDAAYSANSTELSSAFPSRLEQLPQDMHLNVLEHLHQAHPKSLLSAALASKTMHAHVEATGKLKAERLMHHANSVWRNQARASIVVAEVIADLNDARIPLSSAYRLAIMEQFLPEHVTASSARDLVGLVESLKREHQVKAIQLACRWLPPQSGPGNVELFDRLVNLVESFRTVEDRSKAIHLLEYFYRIPESERLTRFDRLAPLWEAIQNEQVKAKGSNGLFSAIDMLPLEARHERFTRYADASHDFQEAADKAIVVFMQVRCLRHLPQEVRRDVFDKLVAIVGSIGDGEGKRKVVKFLQEVTQALDANERGEALASIPA